MCGIAGVARIDGGMLTPAADELLRDVACTLAHRGPDDERLLREDQVGLAFTRLSLVDPVGGGQPLVSEDGSVVLIANGEVYNHRELAASLPAGARFKTQSDCEVLLHLYQRDGLNFLDRVNGMIAVVLWDRKRGKLLFARDRFGIKPLFYHRNRERIVFASEIKALFADPATPRRLDWSGALADYGMSSAPALVHEPVNTWFEDIHLAPAATVMEIDLKDGATREHRYWSLPGAAADSDASDEEYIARYRDLLAESVRDCAMADAELGLFLSGGVDSSAVAALAGQSGLRTFSVLTGSTVLNGDAEWSHRAARLLGVPNEQILFDRDRVPGIEEWKNLLWLTETPLCSPEQFYKYELHRHARLRHPEIKGMLLGAAADEFNGGYAIGYAGGGDWDDFLANIGAMARRTSLDEQPRMAGWWEVSDLPLLKDAAVRGTRDDGFADPYDAFVAWKYRSLQQYNVWHEDRTAAGNSVEARVPFLDHRLVELVTSIPAARRANLLWDKRILREAMVGILPEELIRRPKVPFFHGEGQRHTYRTFTRMLAQGGDALLEEAFSSERAREFIHQDGVRESLRRLERDPENGSVEHLLRLVNLGLLERMTAELPVHPAAASKAPQPVTHPYADWEDAEEQIRELTLQRTPVDPEAVYAMRSDTVLACAPAQPGTWYLLVDGTCEFVLDEDEEPALTALLRSLDGETSLEKVLASAGLSLDGLRPQLEDVLDLGLVVEAAPKGAVRVR
ncbi:asparagine synthase (glutamine-hydrolyzing) [Streptomyces sp. NPDC006544]|uniref:asparagine synthase (glutamine-hydrolyzing) n=1 Tax=Streptomyces sp. NPDC006544 TaxID=3154583 RepID=UPI0033B5DE7B